MWTKMSFPPVSGAMKPYPFVGLNHFTVPFGIDELPFCLRATPAGSLAPPN
jgi:hypothetical protein